MADNSTVLREYLVALGFKVDDASSKKAEGSLSKMDTRITSLARGALAAAGAVQAMVTVFAYQMEKLHYASKRTEASVGNIKALDYAFRQLGGSGDQIRSSLENMSRAMRLNPGLTGLLQQLGIQVTGRDKADVLNDLVTQLNKMPHYIAAQYANLFGIDPDTLLTLQQNLDKFKELQALRKQMAKDAGVDSDAAAEAGMRYASALREIWERVGILKDALSIKLLPAMMETAQVINLMLGDLTKLVNQFTTWADLTQRFKEGITGKVGGGVQLSEDSQIRLGMAGDPHVAPSWWDRMKESAGSMFGGKKSDTAKPPPPAATSSGTSMSGSMEEKQAYLASLELKYGLPPGWLDRVWKKESNRGDPRYMKSSAGALGHFQFMPKTAQQYGLKDPMDFNTSAEASARYFANLKKMFNGDTAKMAAGYNWGEGNVMNKGLGAAPAETRGYVQSVAGITIPQTNHITVTGVSDPQKAATMTADAMGRVNNDLVRNLKPGVQ